MKRKIENLLSDFVWPWWFPYPSSWLRTAILVPLAFPFNILILLGIVGIFISASEQNWIVLVFSIIAGLVLPTLILSFFYHIFWYKWRKNGDPARKSGWFPQRESFWQGFAAMLVMMLSFGTLLTLFLSIIYVGCNLSYSGSENKVFECSSRSLGRITGAIASQTLNVFNLEGEGIVIKEYEQTDARPWFFIWAFIAAYFYQAEHFAVKYLFPWVWRKIRESRQTHSPPTPPARTIDPINLELAKLRGDMGLISVSKPQGKRIYKQPSARSHSFPSQYLQLPAFMLTGFTLAIALYFGIKHLPLAPQAETVLPTVTPSLTAPIVQSDPFSEAVKSATQAAQLAQVAKTSSDWQLVAQQWQTAATLMKSVPSDRVQFNLARQKAVEYEKNFQYASKNAEK